MDFAIAPPIKAALSQLVSEHDFGYPLRDGERADRAISNAFVRRMKTRFDWAVDVDMVQPVADLVQACFASVIAFSDPSDSVVLQVPAYPPFRESIIDNGRRIIEHPLRDTGDQFALDLEALVRLIEPQTKIILFCHPQNPTGRAYGMEELRAFAQVAIDHDLIVVSDEIHCDLVHTPFKHIPLASVSPEIAERTVTLSSATKGFNIAGLRCGVLHFGSEQLMRRFYQRIPRKFLGQVGITGVDATVAAWDHSQPWLDEVKQHLLDARNHLATRMAKELPQARMYIPQASYLAWIDMSRIGLDTSPFDFFLEKARVAYSEGASFGPQYNSFVRLNFATSRPILDAILDRSFDAVHAFQRQRRGRNDLATGAAILQRQKP
jgi:cystathionine beta-lyase